MFVGPLLGLGMQWPTKHCLSLQSLLIVQKNSQTKSPWNTREADCRPASGEGVWEVGHGLLLGCSFIQCACTIYPQMTCDEKYTGLDG